MSPDNSIELLNIIEKAQNQNLCPNRIWQVASHARDRWSDLVASLQRFCALLPDNALQHEEHSACTLDFCEFSTRNFTALRQYHERKPYEGEDQAEIARNHENNGICFPTRGLFDDDLLVKAVQAGRLTAWRLDGTNVLEHPRPFMVISHVWSDGTGGGTWDSKQVNECLYTYFKEIAEQFSCEGIWWDTLCVPADRDARAKALQIMDFNYAYAKVTVVHDRLLRKLEFTDPDMACFAIVMSAWFTRGWTALELARSRKVKIIFKDSIRDLDRDILRKATQDRLAITLIQNLRYSQISAIQDLLVILGPRYTSWAKDMATIAGLLTGISTPDPGRRVEKRDTFQRDTYQQILKKVGKISHDHLFHRSATMSGGFSWCAASLFDLPQSNMEPRLQVHEDGAIVGWWEAYPSDAVDVEQCLWGNSHEVFEARLRQALKKRSKNHVLLIPPAQEERAANGQKLFWKGVLGEILQKHCGAGKLFKSQFAGTLDFKVAFQYDDCSVTKEVTIGGDLDGWMELEDDETAWQIVGGHPLKQTPLAEGRDLELPIRKGKAKAKSAHFETSCEHSAENNEDRHFDYQKKMESRRNSEASTNPTKGLSGVYFDADSEWTAFHHDVWLDRVTDSINDTECWTNSDRLGQQALHLAAERGNWKIVATILDRCDSSLALLTARDARGQTPLHRGAWGGSVEVVDVLLKHSKELTEDAIINVKDKLRDTALHVAAIMGFEEVADCLCAHAETRVGELIQAKGRYGLTPLHYAAMNGRYEVARQLVRRGAMVNIQDDQFLWTPLHCAADSGHLQIVTLLFEEGAKVEDVDKIGWTPLHFAAINGHIHLVTLFTEKNTHLAERKDKFGWTPLNFAAIDGHGVLVQELAERGISANMEDDLLGWKSLRNTVSNLIGQAGETTQKPLHFEGISRYQSAFRLFDQKMKYGGKQRLTRSPTRSNKEVEGNAERCDGDDKLYLHLLHLIALNGRDSVMLQVLKMEILPSERVFYSATLGGNVDAKDSRGLTPLFEAAQWSQLLVMRLLIENGANTESEDKEGQTLLLFALKRKFRGLVKFLLDTPGTRANLRDRDNNTPLILAASNGDAESVELLLRTGRAEPNAKDVNSITALIEAADRGFTNIAKRLLQTGAIDANVSDDFARTPLSLAAQPDPKDSHLETPLHLAAKYGLHGIVKRLLDTSEVDVNTRNKLEFTPLETAASCGHESIVEQLLHTEAIECDCVDSVGNTPLYVAVSNGDEAIVRLLLETERVDINRQNWTGYPLLLEAVRKGYERIFSLLLNMGHARVDVLGKNEETPLCLAAQSGSEAIARKLLDMTPADIDRKDSSNRTPLSFAAENAHSEIVRLLLGSEIAVDSIDKLGRTPLSYAAECGNIETARLLLDTGRTKINSRDRSNRTPLHYAARRGPEGIVKMLLRVDKVKIDSPDREGLTPLTSAADAGQVSIVKLLLETGRVKINSEDKYGRTPLHYAAENQRPHMVRLLLGQRGIQINTVDKKGKTPLLWSISNERTESARLLLDAGEVGIDLADEDGSTPLALAAARGNFDLVNLLLETGRVRVDHRARNGETPMMTAAKRGHTDVMRLLLDTGRVRTDAVDRGAHTALHYAARDGEESSVKLLLDRDIKQVSRKTSYGKTPLSIADDRHHDGVVKLFHSYGIFE
ncbi:MAG: hypothetical protein Q9165_001213 [Trypethelium subeluteriae]